MFLTAIIVLCQKLFYIYTNTFATFQNRLVSFQYRLGHFQECLTFVQEGTRMKQMDLDFYREEHHEVVDSLIENMAHHISTPSPACLRRAGEGVRVLYYSSFLLTHISDLKTITERTRLNHPLPPPTWRGI